MHWRNKALSFLCPTLWWCHGGWAVSITFDGTMEVGEEAEVFYAVQGFASVDDFDIGRDLTLNVEREFFVRDVSAEISCFWFSVGFAATIGACAVRYGARGSTGYLIFIATCLRGRKRRQRVCFAIVELQDFLCGVLLILLMVECTKHR